MSQPVCKLTTTEIEYQQCLAIRRLVFIEEQSVPKEIEIDEYESIANHFLVTIDNQPVATGRLRPKDQLIKFERIASIPTVRGLGAGKVLMNYMLEYALKNYSDYLPAMHAQKSAYGFYEKLGWIPVGEEFTEADIQHQMMIHPSQNADKEKISL
jgi:predicted GNAT family N-acyltransferase